MSNTQKKHNDVKAQLDRQMKSLFEVLDDVLKMKAKQNVELSANNPLKRSLDRYKKVYDLTTHDEHVHDLMFLYNKFRQDILSGSDAWLTKNLVVLYFENNVKSESKVMLSTLYNDALRMREATKNTLKDLPKESYAGRRELLFCDYIRDYLFNAFYLALKEGNEDREAILNLIVDLEQQAGISTSSTVSGTPPLGGNDLFSGLDPANPMPGIMGMAQDMMKKFGLNMPPGDKMPKDMDMSKILGTFLQSNPQLQGMVQGLASSFQGIAANPSSTPATTTTSSTPATTTSTPETTPATISSTPATTTTSSDTQAPIGIDLNNLVGNLGQLLQNPQMLQTMAQTIQSNPQFANMANSFLSGMAPPNTSSAPTSATPQVTEYHEGEHDAS